MLHSLSLLLTEGTRNIRANNGLVPEDYTLVSEDAVRITVDANGVSTHDKVEFIYHVPGVSADVEIHYVDGENVLKTTTLTLDEGTTSVYPAAALLPDGYVLTDTDPVLVTVDANGAVSPAVVTFRITAE